MTRNPDNFELRLNELNVDFTDLLSTLGSGVRLIDRNYKILYQNRVMNDIVGDITGTECYKGLHGKGTPCENCPVAQTLKDGRSHSVERPLFRGGYKRYFSVTSSPVRDVSGNIVGATEVVHETTDLKLAENRLRENNDILKQFTSHIDSVLWIVTVDLKKVIFVSDAYHKVFERPIKALFEDTMAWVDFVHPDDVPLVQRDIERILEHGNCVSEFRIVMPDGRVKWLRNEAFSITGEDGNSAMYAGMTKEVTGEKDAEARKAGFYSMIKHDLKGILTLIKGNVDLLKKAMDNHGAVPQCAASLDAISRNSGLISNIVEDIAFYSSLDAGRHFLRLDSQPVDLLVRETVAMHSSIIESKGMELVREVEPGLPDILVDRHLMSRALVNLVLNAVSYSGGDKITVSARKTLLGGMDAVDISVSDNGKGIGGEHHEKVFQTHYRVPSPGNPYGSGLGLAIVKQIAEAHSGRASITSKPGEGCTFTITLPVYGRAG